jgi:hypothetical protein
MFKKRGRSLPDDQLFIASIPISHETGRSLIMSMTRADKNQTRLEYNLVFYAVYPIFLIAVAFSRLLPRASRWSVSARDEGKSIFKVARIATLNSIPFAFM